MKKLLFSLPPFLSVVLISLSPAGLTSCEKEIELVHDTVVVVKKDTLIYRDTVTLAFRPCNNRNEVNIASLWEGNNINLQELPAFHWTYDGISYENRSLLKFDLTSIPANRTIISAQLSLYAVPNPVNGNKIDAHTGTNNAVLIQRITETWDTTTLSWANQPSTATVNQIELPVATNPFLNYENLNVSNIVKEMHSQENFGMMIKLKNQAIYNIQNFASSKHANANLHPKLVVTYSKP